MTRRSVRAFYALLVIGWTFGCTSQTASIELSDGPWTGYKPPALKRVTGTNRMADTSEQIDYYCLAFGSGLTGFESVELSNRTSLVIILERHEKWRSYAATLTQGEATELMELFSSALKANLAEQYLGFAVDGTQAILAADGPKFRYSVWMCNWFHPIFTRFYDQINVFLRKLPKNRFRHRREPDPYAIQRHVIG